jgi:hypothetical protein
MRRAARRSMVTKLVMSVALITVAAALVGVGAFAAFTNTVSVSQADTSGTVTMAVINVNGANNRLSVGASNLAAGDTIQRVADLQETGSIDLAGIVLTTTASPSSLLDTDATNGLQMVIDKCSVAWTEGGSAPAYTYTCGGTTTSVLATRAVIGTNLTLTNLVLSGNAHNYVRVTQTLPSSAPNTLQGQSSTINYALTGTQRTAAAQ